VFLSKFGIKLPPDELDLFEFEGMSSKHFVAGFTPAREAILIKERRPIQPIEIEVIRTTLVEACIHFVDPIAILSLQSLFIAARCECGCSSIEFDVPIVLNRQKPIGDGIGITPNGGKVGIIVWGDETAITGLEIYDLGAGDGDLVLPLPVSIASWENCGQD
jgi:hypothetical protein